MPNLNLSQARVIDPILSEVAIGYKQPASFVADTLFPIVDVLARGGTIITFGPEDFVLASTRRAPGQNTKRVQFGRGTGSYLLGDYSLEGQVTIEQMEESSAVPNIDEGARAVSGVLKIMQLEREYEAATAARNASAYSAGSKIVLSGTSQFSDPASDPVTIVNTGKEAIRSQIGQRPNHFTLSPTVLAALRVNPKILALRGNADLKTPLTLSELSKIFEIEVVMEAGAIYHNGTNFVDVWGKDALLTYQDKASVAEYGAPGFGYTYQLKGYPVVEQAYYDRNSKTWFYPTTMVRQCNLVGPSSGYLIQNAIA